MVTFELVVALLSGVPVGFAVCWWYFKWTRLIRTRYEWYSDPVIHARYPEEADKELQKPDRW